MRFEVGDTVFWRTDTTEPGVIESVGSTQIAVRWQRAGLVTYGIEFWNALTLIEKNNNSEFKTIEVVKNEDFTGTVVEYKGRKYKLSLVE